MMAPRSLHASESGSVAHCKLELAEKGKSHLEKTHLQNFTDPTEEAVEKTTGKEDDVAGEGGRLR